VIAVEAVLDELDKKIMHHLCSGAHSYTELGHICHAARNTIYRRISRLENMGIISRKMMAIPNFTKLNLSSICIGMDVAQADVDQVISFLKRQHQVKFLWKTFGTHNVITVIICNKGEEGQCISNFRDILEKMRVKTLGFDVSVSFTWEKTDFSPY